MKIKITSTKGSLRKIVKRFSEAEKYLQICWMARLALTVPVLNAGLEYEGIAIKRIKTHNRSNMKINLLNALLMTSMNGPAFNTTACNTLITQACAEFQDKKHQNKPCSFQSVIKSKSMSTQVFMKRSQIFFF